MTLTEAAAEYRAAEAAMPRPMEVYCLIGHNDKIDRVNKAARALLIAALKDDDREV